MELTVKMLSGVRILCVDDSPDSLELLRLILTRQEAHLTVCTSAEKAIEILQTERFDVIISDISMPPGLDGYDLMHALREMEAQDPTRQATPTVAVSGDALRISRKRRYADFQVYMQKPVDRVRLVHFVERLVEADAEAVELGSLGIWEASQATKAAVVATYVAASATSAAADDTVAAFNATVAAVSATAAAVTATTEAKEATVTASDVESKANLASANAL
jgi:CheY-like chemotaxis protein